MADTMKMMVVEGTVDQMVEFAKKLGVSTSAVAIAASQPLVEEVDEGEEAEQPVVTVEFARRFLNRRSLADGQKTVLRLTAEATPGWILATELQEALSYSPAQFAGVMGAFGRRLTHTDGYIDGSWFFDQEWVDDAGCYRYRLPGNVMTALRAEKII